MNSFSLISGLSSLFQTGGSVDTGPAAESETSLKEMSGKEEAAGSNGFAVSGTVSPLTATGTEEDLPIGEALPEGEHVRSLRVFSVGNEGENGSSGEGTRSSPAPDSSRSVREVHVLQVFRNPDVMVAPHLLTKAQCLHLLQLAEGKWKRSKTSIGLATSPQTQYTTTESKTRTSKSVMLRESQTPGVTSVELLACALARMPLQHLESLVLVRYDEGEYFNEHHDGAFRPQTVLIYLNEVEDGGFTHFTRLGLKIAPAEGSAAVWGNVTPQGTMDNRMLHAGMAPTKGTKYVVNCFFNESVIRFAQPAKPLAAADETEAERSTKTAQDATRDPPRELGLVLQQQRSEQPVAMHAPPVLVLRQNPRPSPVQGWPLPHSRTAFQRSWGAAVLPLSHQLRHQELLRQLASPQLVSGAPKFLSPPVGLPFGLF